MEISIGNFDEVYEVYKFQKTDVRHTVAFQTKKTCVASSVLLKFVGKSGGLATNASDKKHVGCHFHGLIDMDATWVSTQK